MTQAWAGQILCLNISPGAGCPERWPASPLSPRQTCNLRARPDAGMTGFAAVGTPRLRARPFPKPRSRGLAKLPARRIAPSATTALWIPEGFAQQQAAADIKSARIWLGGLVIMMSKNIGPV